MGWRDVASHQFDVGIVRNVERLFELLLHVTSLGALFVDTGEGELAVLNVDLNEQSAVRDAAIDGGIRVL